MANRKQYSAAEYRKFAVQIIIMTVIFLAAAYGSLAVAGRLGEDFALTPLLAIPAAAMGVFVMLASAKHVEKS